MKKIIFVALVLAGFISNDDAWACRAYKDGDPQCCPTGYVMTGKAYSCDLSYAGPSFLSAGCGCSLAPTTTSSSSDSSSSGSTSVTTGMVCEAPGGSTTTSSTGKVPPPSTTGTTGTVDQCYLDGNSPIGSPDRCALRGNGAHWDTHACCCRYNEKAGTDATPSWVCN